MEKIKFSPEKKVISYFDSYKTGLIIYIVSTLCIIFAVFIKTDDIEFTSYVASFFLLFSLIQYYNFKRKKIKAILVDIEFEPISNSVTLQLLNEKDLVSIYKITIADFKIEEVANHYNKYPSYNLAFYINGEYLFTQGPDKYWSIKSLQLIFNTYLTLK